MVDVGRLVPAYRKRAGDRHPPAEHQRRAAAHRLQILAERLAEAARAHGVGVELPRPAALDLLEGVAGDELDDVVVVAGLRRHQPEAGQRLLEARIDALVAHRRRRSRVAGFRLRRADGRIDDDGAAQVGPVCGSEFHRHEAAEAVADHERPPPELCCLDHRGHFPGAQVGRVVAAPAAVAHAGQVDRRDAEIAGEVGRDKRPPVGMRAAAVHQQDAAPVGRLVGALPQQIVDGAAIDVDAMGGSGLADRPTEPCRRGSPNLEMVGRILNGGHWHCLSRERVRSDRGDFRRADAAVSLSTSLAAAADAIPHSETADKTLRGCQRGGEIVCLA